MTKFRDGCKWVELTPDLMRKRREHAPELSMGCDIRKFLKTDADKAPETVAVKKRAKKAAEAAKQEEGKL
jgi:hypothetical protein